MNFDDLEILTPKRSRAQYAGWEGFFPYYAGYPLQFADALIRSAKLPPKAVIFDPWNGSGTTTYAAADAGLCAVGYDLNPVMVAIARARCLPLSEADSLAPLLKHVTEQALAEDPMQRDDALEVWFEEQTAREIRRLETGIRSLLVGEHTITPDGVRLEMLSSMAAAFYVALFSAVRQCTNQFRTTNPTWTKKPKLGSRLSIENGRITAAFMGAIVGMAEALVTRRSQCPGRSIFGEVNIQRADSTSSSPGTDIVDLVLTSPPYCTRIDYVSSTRVELAVMAPLLSETEESLRRLMLGTPLTASTPCEMRGEWGPTCNRFLKDVQSHGSKASGGYYLKTHLDYFGKLYSSISHIHGSLKRQGVAVFVIQDSHYKDIHNPVPQILTEMAEAVGMRHKRQVDFDLARTMASRHPHVGRYRNIRTATESVICFEKVGIC